MGELFRNLRQANGDRDAQIEAYRQEVRVLRAENERLIAQFTPLPVVEQSSPRTEEHTPSPAYLNGEMPTYNIPDLIEHLEFRIMIHETYMGLVDEDPARWSAFGSFEFHQWAIEGYANVLYYLKRLQ